MQEFEFELESLPSELIGLSVLVLKKNIELCNLVFVKTNIS